MNPEAGAASLRSAAEATLPTRVTPVRHAYKNSVITGTSQGIEGPNSRLQRNLWCSEGKPECHLGFILSRQKVQPSSSHPWRTATAMTCGQGCRFHYLLVESAGPSEPLPTAAPRLGRRTVLTFPLLPPPQKN